MKTEWLLAKHVPDLRRYEPHNVGILLWHEGEAGARFLGERADGRIDGRRVRWAGVPGYKAWVQYWRHAIEQGATARRLLEEKQPDAHYFLEPGGELLRARADETTAGLLDRLYGLLVEASDPETLDVTRLSDALLNRLDIGERVDRAIRLEVSTSLGAADVVTFDYRFVNGRPNLMQRVSLSLEDERSWDAAHAAAWVFSRGREAEPDSNFIALVKIRPADKDVERQTGLLAEFAAVVDVGHGSADSRLSELLGIG